VAAILPALSWTLFAPGVTLNAHLSAQGVATVISEGVRVLSAWASFTTWMMLSLMRFRRTTLAPLSGRTSMPVPVCWNVPAWACRPEVRNSTAAATCVCLIRIRIRRSPVFIVVIPGKSRA